MYEISMEKVDFPDITLRLTASFSSFSPKNVKNEKEKMVRFVNSISEPDISLIIKKFIQEIEANMVSVEKKSSGIFEKESLKLYDVIVALGTNMGRLRDNLLCARKLLDESEFFYIDRLSSVYESMPIGYEKQNNFYNMVIKGRTSLSPEKLLIFLKMIEKKCGREWSKRNHPRVLDLDILYYEDFIINTTTLTIPHKERLKRDFVIVPLLEIFPDFIDMETLEPMKNFFFESDIRKVGLL